MQDDVDVNDLLWEQLERTFCSSMFVPYFASHVMGYRNRWARVQGSQFKDQPPLVMEIPYLASPPRLGNIVSFIRLAQVIRNFRCLLSCARDRAVDADHCVIDISLYETTSPDERAVSAGGMFAARRSVYEDERSDSECENDGPIRPPAARRTQRPLYEDDDEIGLLAFG